MIKTCIGYPGGKSKAVDIILPLIPDGIKDWREPFFGGGSVTIAFLQSSKAKSVEKVIVGDLYYDLYSFWYSLKNDFDKMIKRISWYVEQFIGFYDTSEVDEKDKNNLVAKFHELYDYMVNTPDVDIIDTGAKFLIFNMISFSGLGKAGKVSNSRVTNINFLRKFETLEKVSNLLKAKNIEIYNCSYEKTIEGIGENSFIFFDPPYITQMKSGLYGNNGELHSKFDYVKFAEICKYISEYTKCKWLMTIDDGFEARKLFRNFYIKPFKLNYTFNTNSREDSLDGEELFVANYPLEDKGDYKLLASL